MTMSKVTIQADACAVTRGAQPNVHETPQDISTIRDGDALWIRWQQAAALQGKRIQACTVRAYTRDEQQIVVVGINAIGLTLKAPETMPDIETITAAAAPQTSRVSVMYPAGSGQDWYANEAKLTDKDNRPLRALLEYGAVLTTPYDPRGYTHEYRIYTTSHAPEIEVEYTDPETIQIGTASPSGGYVRRDIAQEFAWTYKDVDGEIYGGLTQSAGALQWRVGTGGTITSIDVGTEQRYTMPAGTLPASTSNIQWRISATVGGMAVTSSWYTLTTIDATPSADPISPIGGYVDGTETVTFVWRHTISTGTPQQKYDLQQSADGTTWTALRSETTAQQTADVQAGTLQSGTLHWRVRTYNTDGVAGDWSAAVQTEVIAAPAAPSVTIADSSPRPLVRWQSSDQQAREIAIDTDAADYAFGTGKSYRVNRYLADGTHTVRVRVQNQYGLWSPWGAASVTVRNLTAQGGEITLTAQGGESAELSWTTSVAYDGYAVYRDGQLIAKTTGKRYVDQLTVGEHSYQVRGVWTSNGNYALSNAVGVTIAMRCPVLTDVLTGEQILLPLSDSRDRKTTLSIKQQVSLMHYAGAALPSAEVSEWVDRTMSVTAAFRRGADASRILALRGRVCCLRDQYGNTVTGVVVGWEVNAGPFYTTYSTTITDIQWQEALTHDPIA